MEKNIDDRAMLLLEKTSIAELDRLGSTSYTRWQNIKRGKARFGAAEIEILGKAYPEFRWWLMTGGEEPDIGQISPMSKDVQKELKRTGTE
ncbi:hypothetical protein V6U78_07405 [Marinospirillum sp. MEB164]|uniref:DNA-binding protein n=1 Tax=Marinospirillum alkalitolerans TaxID=3123374 RepID=A0ABW8PX46_9GAMM